MKVEWDYTELAEAYLKRPDYAVEAIDEILEIASVKKGDAVCDVGAGAAHLTLLLGKKGLNVKAIEPNDAMRANGIRRTAELKNVEWFEGVGEDTKQPADLFKLVTFGSSFNVTDRQQALAEVKRILVKDGWFACIWNHRDLSDSLQQSIEEIIKKHVKDYTYGSRREDQTEVIQRSGLYKNIQMIEKTVIHQVPTKDFIEGWRSHGTIHRQAKDCFDLIMSEIEEEILKLEKETVAVPYTTRGWIAQVIK